MKVGLNARPTTRSARPKGAHDPMAPTEATRGGPADPAPAPEAHRGGHTEHADPAEHAAQFGAQERIGN